MTGCALKEGFHSSFFWWFFDVIRAWFLLVRLLSCGLLRLLGLLRDVGCAPDFSRSCSRFRFWLSLFGSCSMVMLSWLKRTCFRFSAISQGFWGTSGGFVKLNCCGRSVFSFSSYVMSRCWPLVDSILYSLSSSLISLLSSDKERQQLTQASFQQSPLSWRSFSKLQASTNGRLFLTVIQLQSASHTIDRQSCSAVVMLCSFEENWSEVSFLPKAHTRKTKGQ